MLTREEIQAFKARKLEKKYKDIFSSKDMLDKVSQLDQRLEKLKSGLKNFDDNFLKKQREAREF